jgi:endonuclease YncB( thermonuclease family)
MTRFIILISIALFVSCNTTKESKRYTKDEASGLMKKLEVVSLDLGEFPFDGPSAVLDGDTVKVRGSQASFRLLAIDTEETFKKANEKAAFANGWEQYKKDNRGKSVRPVKMATPVGEDAKHFAQEFFTDVKTVKLERDHPGEIRDFFNRYLAYIFAKKNGEWVNYNVECVRAGMSPYFMKYGRSRRFHKEFIQAEKEAKEAQRGVWSPDGLHYDDYPERLGWWAERERAITLFEKEQVQHPDTHIALTRWDAMLRLEQRVGQEVFVLGSVGEVVFRETGPSVVKLARTRTASFEIVFFDKDILLATGLQFKKGEYVQVRGVVQKYKDSRGSERLQLQVSLPGQVLAPSKELEKLLTIEEPDDKADLKHIEEEGE